MRIGGLFELRDGNARELAERYERWRTTAADARILGAIYVVQPQGVFRFDPEQGALRPSQLPAKKLRHYSND